MKRLALPLILLPSLALAQTPARGDLFSSQSIMEFGQALTQTSHFGIPRIAADPTCTVAMEGRLWENTTSHTVKGCLNGSASAVGGGTTLAFSGLTSATNTTAAMVVGTGASIAASGTGTITATNIVAGTGTASFAGPSAARIFTLPDAAGTIPTGSGTNGQVTLWGASGVTGDTGLTYSGTGATFKLVVGAGGSTTAGLQLGSGAGVEGAQATPYLTFGNNNTTGWWLRATDTWSFAAGGNALFELASGVARLGTNTLTFGSGVTTSDTGLSRISAGVVGVGTGAAAAVDGELDLTYLKGASGVLQLGAANAASPVAQTLQAQGSRSGTDSNVAGGSLTIKPGAGTGTGAGAKVQDMRNIMAASGSGAQLVSPAFTSCESKTLSNTSATATAIVNIGLANNTSGAARATISVQCTDGTNFDSDIITSYVAYVNKAGTLTFGTPVTTASAAANNSGSCTVAPTWVANGTTSVDLKVTPVIGTIVPTTTLAMVNIETFGNNAGAVACQ